MTTSLLGRNLQSDYENESSGGKHQSGDVPDSRRRSTTTTTTTTTKTTTTTTEFTHTNDKENSTPSRLDTALVETPAPAAASINRFSFSKLTKFVSKSALKVMSRKVSSSSAMSLDSSSSSSSSSISSPSTPSFDEEDQHASKKHAPIQAPNLPLPQLPDVHSNGVYICEEQRLDAERRVAKLIDDQRTHRQTLSSRMPHMGVTSLMLREMKKKQGEGYSTIGVMPIACLITAPHVFSSSSSSSSAQSSCSSSPRVSAASNPPPVTPEQPTYDRLARMPFLGDETPTIYGKKSASRPIVKSLSSIAPIASTTAPRSPVSSYVAPTTPNCRISIFSSKNAACKSTGRLVHAVTTTNSVAGLESTFSETVF